MEFKFILVLIILFAVVAVIAGIYSHRQRIKFWSELAREWGFRYRTDDPYRFGDREEFPLFSEGDSRKVPHLIEGRVGEEEMSLFDYQYSTGSGKNRRTHHLSALMFSTHVIGHRLVVCPETFFDRIAGFFGFDDIDFEFEEFNRAFKVKSDDKKFAYDVFHTGMMEFFMKHRSLCVEWCMTKILFYENGEKQFNQESAHRYRQIAEEFMELLPDYLKQQYARGKS